MAFVSPNTWRAWKRTCSVGGCDAIQRYELHSVIVFNLRQALSQWNAALPNYTDDDLAALFDDHFRLGLGETGASRKDHLFHSFDHVKDDEESWARLITAFIKTTVRRYKSIARDIARQEGRTGPIEPAVQVDHIGTTHDEDTHLANVFQDPNALPDALASANDMKAIAERLAPGYFARLDSAQKSVLWAYEVQPAERIGEKAHLNDPEVVALSGSSLSKTYAARLELLRNLEASLSRTMGGDPQDIRALAGHVILAMLPLAEEWGKRGKSSG